MTVRFSALVYDLYPIFTLVSPSYTLQSVAYNIRDPTAAYLRPPLLTSEEWDKECAEHATDDSVAPALPLIPVAIDGFEGLNARMDAQDAQVKEFLKSSEASAILGR